MKDQALLNRFLEYVKIDTQADPSSESIPSAKKELDMIDLLEKQLKELNINTTREKYGFLVALIPSNTDKKVPAIGFLAHVDTAPDYAGKDVKPNIIENYQGEDIKFADGEVLSTKSFPELKDAINKTLITTDGTTLLGSDDKAGVSVIMEMLKHFVDHPELKHGDIYAAFTLDEEIGTGVDNFDLAHFKPEFAYTIDGGELGELNYETFNAAGLVLEIKGLSVHPGSAKNKMINAMEVGFKFHSMLPDLDRPEYTEDYEGFYALMQASGGIEHAKFNYIIRDHSKEVFEYRKNEVEMIIAKLQEWYGKDIIKYELNDQYYNMKEPVLEKQIALDLAVEAMKQNGVEPLIRPIRGGTDGSKLSFRGIPCPNLFTGGYNFHGKYEFNIFDDMIKAKDVIIDIVLDNEKNA